VTRFTLQLGREFVDFGNLAIASDGSRIAFVAAEADGEHRLYVRELDAFESKPLEATEGASDPFFSPDGRWLVFIGPPGQLKKVSVAGGPPIEVGHIPGVHSPVWGSDDTIVVGDVHSRILRVSASSDGVRPLEAFGGSDDRSAPLQLLSDGELLVTTWRKDGKGLVERVSLESGERRTLLRALVDASGNHLLPSGHFVWGSAGTLLAARLDLAGGKPAGSPVPVVEGLRSYLGVGHNVAVSDSGTLVYTPSPGPRHGELVWVDRAGKATPVPGGADENFHFHVGGPRLSPDGREAAIILMEGFDRDIWIFDLERGTRRRLTDEGTNLVPRWSPDGSSIAYGSERGRLTGIFRRPSDGGGVEDLLLEHPVMPFPVAWSQDGRRLAFVAWETPGIWVHSIGGETAMVVKDPVESPRLSPDWRWLAFQAGETGRNEIYLQPFPGPGARHVVSTSGGTRPAWAPTGDELFYHSGNRVMAVRLQTTPELRVGKPEVLFEGPYGQGMSVSPDGKRFLLLREDPSPITELRVVVNWDEELKRLVP
jgi:Tol biopolymer transport system component